MKHAFFALVLMLLLGPARAYAQQALLWIPSPEAGIEEILSILEENKDLRLTAALTEIPESAALRLKKLQEDGGLELVLRPEWDPPLPLLYYPSLETVKWEGKPSAPAFAGDDRQFLMFRLDRARETSKRYFKKIPDGLVIPPGGLVEDYFPLARASGFKWLACGPLASTAAAVFEAGGVAVVPFTPYPGAAAGGGLRFTVFDETSAVDAAQLRAGLQKELRGAGRGETLTVSEALKTAPSSASSPSGIAAMSSPWSGDYTVWASTPLQRSALAALARTRSDLMLYLNSRGGDYNSAKPAFEEYFAAENGEKLKSLASGDLEERREAETAIRHSLGSAYHLMRRTPVKWSFSSLDEALEAVEDRERLHIASGPGGFEIRNISRKPELPLTGPPLPESADPEKIWKLDKLKVEKLPDAIVFRLYPLALENSGNLPSGFGHVALDLYIDINRRVRAGRTRPLNGRPFRFSSESAWEYALEIAPEKAVLYAAVSKRPVVIGTFPVKAEDGAITVRVPRSVLKGNPLFWGYAALMLAPKEGDGLGVTDYLAAGISGGYIRAVRPDRK